MKFCAIIPDRGDRPQFASFALHQLERQTVKPDKIYHIEHKPRKDGIDLIDRVKAGVEFAIKDGMDWVFIIENDDYYPSDYFNRFLPHLDKYDFIGDDKSCYYNINTNRWSLFTHTFRASLFTTAFRLSALNLFEWPAEGPNLDMAIWRYARHRRRKFIDTGAIGIKHGIGLCAGRGHEMKLNHADPDMEWLKAHVDSEAYVFYRSIKKAGPSGTRIASTPAFTIACDNGTQLDAKINKI